MVIGFNGQEIGSQGGLMRISKIEGLDKGIFNQSYMEDAADFGVQIVSEIIMDDSKVLLAKHDTIWTGNLMSSLTINNIEKMKKEVIASTDYAEDIEFGKDLSDPGTFKPFYQNRILTDFGEWALAKMDEVREPEPKDGIHLVMSNGRKVKGIRVNKEHPFMLQQGKDTAFQYAINRYCHKDNFIFAFMQKLNE